MQFTLVSLLVLLPAVLARRQHRPSRGSPQLTTSSQVPPTVSLERILPIIPIQPPQGEIVAKTTDVCYTSFSNRPSFPIATNSLTVTVSTKTHTDRTVVHPTTTTTKPRFTVTRTSLTTVTSTITPGDSRRHRTKTIYELVTSTITSSFTSTLSTIQTSTTGDGTSTVATSSGFVPAGPSQGPPIRAAAQPRHIEARQSAAPIAEIVADSGFGGQRYPTSVLCIAKVTIYSETTLTRTIGPTITTIFQGRPTVTTSFITETDITIAGGGPRRTTTTVTLTDLITVNVTTTTTTFTSTTTTSASPTATFYAACGPNNALSTLRNGQSISDFRSNTRRFNFLEVSAKSQYECCVRCINDPTCDFSLYNLGTDNCGQEGQCFQINQGGVCPQRNPFIKAVHNPLCPGTIAISSGNCGHLRF